MAIKAQQGSWLGTRLILTTMLLYAMQVFADPERSADRIESLQLLKSQNHAALERHYSARQQAYEAGAISEEALYGDFRLLCDLPSKQS